MWLHSLPSTTGPPQVCRECNGGYKLNRMDANGDTEKTTNVASRTDKGEVYRREGGNAHEKCEYQCEAVDAMLSAPPATATTACTTKRAAGGGPKQVTGTSGGTADKLPMHECQKR